MLISPTRHGLFFSTLREVYSAESQLALMLPIVIEKGSISRGLRSVVEEAHARTHTQLVRLESIFALLEESCTSDPCCSISSLLVDAAEAAEAADAAARDVGTALALVGVKHMEIVRYQALHMWALNQGLQETGDQLRKSLLEELETARLLTLHAMGAGSLPAPSGLEHGPTLH